MEKHDPDRAITFVCLFARSTSFRRSIACAPVRTYERPHWRTIRAPSNLARISRARAVLIDRKLHSIRLVCRFGLARTRALCRRSFVPSRPSDIKVDETPRHRLIVCSYPSCSARTSRLGAAAADNDDTERNRARTTNCTRI